MWTISELRRRLFGRTHTARAARPAPRTRLALTPLEGRSVPAALGGGFTDHGLTGTYYADTNYTAAAFTRKDVRLDFDWNGTMKPGGSLSPGFRDVASDNYSARWTGQLISRFSETYTFSGTADDVLQLELKPAGSGTWATVVNQAGAAPSFSGTYAMTAGQTYDVRVSFKEFTGDAVLKLRWSSPSTPLGIIEPLAQSGINNPDGSAAFTDIVRGARNSWEGVDGGPRPGTDANGWPTGSGSYIFQESLNQGLDVDPLMRGRLSYSFNGRADVGLFGNVDGGSLTYSYNSATNTSSGTFTVRNGGSNASAFLFRNATRNGQAGGPGGITNLKLIRPVAPDSTTAYNPDELFTNQMKEAHTHVTVVRHQLVANQQKDWSDRTLPGYFNQAAGTITAAKYGIGDPSSNGWSWEHKVMFANETGRDLMLSIPTVATGRTPADVNSYVNKLANLIRYGSDGVNPYTAPQANPVYPPLNPNLRVYLELENELWNFFGVFYTDYGNLNKITAEALDARGEDFNALTFDGISTAKNGNGDYNEMTTLRLRMAMLRTVQFSNIFRGVYGDASMPGTSTDPRIRPVYQWQYDNLNGTAQTALQWADRYFNNGDGSTRFSPPRPVNYYLWGGGGAAYYGANNPNGLTDRVSNPGFDSTAVGNGYTQNPSGTGWTYVGAAGVARDGGGSDDIPTPFNGSQTGYVAGTGRVTASFTVPAGQTSDVYGFVFKAHNRRKAGASDPDTQNLRVYLDYGTPNQVDITAKTFSQGNGYTPPAIDQIGAWNARNVFWVESQYYYTKSFNLAAGSAHTVTIVGTGAADQLAFLEDIRLTSVDAIFAGGIPGGGEATGQPAGQNIRNTMGVANNWATAYGLQHIAYESGWSLGGDDGGSSVQLKAKYGDSRTAAAQSTFMDYYHEAGGVVNVFGTYAQWPSWSDFYAEQGLVDAGAYPIVQGIDQQADRLSNLPTNNTSLATNGSTTVPSVAALSPDWQTDTGPQFSVNRRTQYGYVVYSNAAATYTLSFRLANQATGGRVRVVADGRTVGTIDVPNTGGRDTFQTVGSFAVSLPRGRHGVILIPLANSAGGYAANVGDMIASAGGTVPAPAAPSGLSATAASVSQINLSWLDNSTNETGFVLERSTSSTFASVVGFTLAANSTAYSDTGLQAGVTYFYRVRATNSAGASANSASASATTQSGTGGPAGYTLAASEGQTVNFASPVDVAYGANGQFAYLYNVTGAVTFNNATFGDPIPGVAKSGYSRPAAGAGGTGLTATYWDNQDFTGATVTRAEGPIGADWGGGSPDAAIGADTFSARWTGQVQAVETGTYTFRTYSDDGVRLWVSGVQVVNNWTLHGPTYDTGTISLTAGQKYDIRLEFFEQTGGALCTLDWQRPGQSGFVAVPRAQLFPAAATGTIRQETWTGVGGTAVSAIPVGTTPNSVTTLTSFEIPTNAADDIGVRVRGYLTAPATGTYVFWIASDDNGELWLGTSDSPASKARIAQVTTWTNSREWGKEAGQKSVAISLVAGQRYYIEALMKEAGGGDNLAVGWARPGQSTAAPSEVIPGSVLSPFEG